MRNREWRVSRWPAAGLGLAALAADDEGNAWFGSNGQDESGTFRVRRVSPSSFAVTVAGGGFDSGAAARGNEATFRLQGRKKGAIGKDGTYYLVSGGQGLYRISRIVR